MSKLALLFVQLYSLRVAITQHTRFALIEERSEAKSCRRVALWKKEWERSSSLVRSRASCGQQFVRLQQLRPCFLRFYTTSAALAASPASTALLCCKTPSLQQQVGQFACWGSGRSWSRCVRARHSQNAVQVGTLRRPRAHFPHPWDSAARFFAAHGAGITNTKSLAPGGCRRLP